MYDLWYVWFNFNVAAAYYCLYNCTRLCFTSQWAGRLTMAVWQMNCLLNSSKINRNNYWRWPAIPQSERVKSVFLMVIKALLYHIWWSIGIPLRQPYSPMCQLITILQNNKHSSALTRTGKCHSLVPPRPLLGKQDLALSRCPLVLLW